MSAAALAVCVLALASSFLATRRSLVAGLLTTLLWGYLYGILRANLLSNYSHLIFDFALTGCYLGGFLSGEWPKGPRVRRLTTWLAVLIGWALLLALLPFQTPLVTLVGLRGNAFFLPVLLLGCRMRNEHLLPLARGLVVLNLLALGFAVAEYRLGMPRFFPLTAVTEILYRSSDAGGGHHRIPGPFANAHAYGGAMVATLPFLLGAWGQQGQRMWQKWWLVLGVVAAFLGILAASSRLSFLVAVLIVCVTLLRSGLGLRQRVVFAVLVIALGLVAVSNRRFQRFKTLNVEMMVDRFAGSVNRRFFEVLLEYPMGNGLGGGGTSIPYFLRDQARLPVMIESEFARIGLEQGFIGLLLWGSFIGWALIAGAKLGPDVSLTTRRLAWVYVLASFVTGAIGVGLLTAIPGAFFLMLCIGWLTAGSGSAHWLAARPVPAAHRPGATVPVWSGPRRQA